MGIIFTYWIQGQIIYENIRSYVVTGATFGVILSLAYKGLDMVTSWHNEQKKEKKEDIDNLGKHTNDLLPVLQKIAENPSTSSTEYLFSLAQQHITSDEQLNNILNGEDGLKNTEFSYTALQKKIDTHIENAIETEFLKLESAIFCILFEDIKDFLKKISVKGKSYVFVAVTDSSNLITSLQSTRSDGLVINTYLTGKKEELLVSAKAMNDLLTDTSLKEMFNTQEILGQRLYQLRLTFKQKIHEIINEITYSVSSEGKILSGYCKKCEDIKKKWKINPKK
jgi:hypothetical protein